MGLAFVGVALALLVVACGGGGKTSQDATGIVAALKADDLPVAETRAFTADDDPNQLLGRPGQYTSKAHFHDTRVDAAGDWSIDGGGGVEVFGKARDAKTRFDFLGNFTSNPLFAEYDYLHGNAILRLSHALTPQQAAAYETAFKQIMGD